MFKSISQLEKRRFKLVELINIENKIIDKMNAIYKISSGKLEKE